MELASKYNPADVEGKWYGSARGPPRAGRCIHGVGQFLNIFGGAEIPFGNDGYGLFLEAIAFCLELDRFFALL